MPVSCPSSLMRLKPTCILTGNAFTFPCVALEISSPKTTKSFSPSLFNINSFLSASCSDLPDSVLYPSARVTLPPSAVAFLLPLFSACLAALSFSSSALLSVCLKSRKLLSSRSGVLFFRAGSGFFCWPKPFFFNHS